MNAVTPTRASNTDQAARDADYLERAKGLAGLIEREADACEAGGTLTAPVIQAFRDTELFWAQIPLELGGGGVGLTGGIEIVEELSRADASTGWSLMANSGAGGVAACFLGPKAFYAIFGGPERPILAGMLGPAGKAVRLPGGYKGGGKFAFGSGSGHADWFGAGMLLLEDGKPQMLPSGIPAVRVFFVPRDKVKMLGGWDVTGLVGTGSYDYEVAETFVEDDFTLERTATTPVRGGALYNVGLATFGAAGHAAVALGLAKRALQEIVQIARAKKRPGYSMVLAENDVFKNQFSLAEATFQATRDYVMHAFGDAQNAVLSGHPFTDEMRGRTRQSATWAHKTCADVVRFAHEAAGSHSIRNPSILGRVTRDMAVATQHVFVDPITLTDAAVPIMKAWLAEIDAAK